MKYIYRFINLLMSIKLYRDGALPPPDIRCERAGNINYFIRAYRGITIC